MYGFLCEETWVKHLWKYLYSDGIQIEDNVEDIPILQEDTICITTHFARAYQEGLVTKSEWLKANTCRKYLKVLTVIDISFGNGKHIDVNVGICRIQYGRTRTTDWANQGKPKVTY